MDDARTRTSSRSHGVVRTTLSRVGSATRAEIQTETGLSRATVAAVVRDLVAAGSVVESRTRSAGGRGRRPVEFRLAARPGLVGAVDLGHRHLAVALGGSDGSIVRSRWLDHDVDTDPGSALSAAADVIRELLEESAEGPLNAVAVSVPQPVSDSSGLVAPTPFLPSWDGLDIASTLSAVFAVPVLIENDANAGALAENDRRGSVAYVKLSTGIGMGIVIGGRLVRGVRGQAGEVGHLVIQPEGQLCGCGSRGCLETLASLPAVVRALAPVHGNLAPADLAQLLRRGDTVALRAMHDAGVALGTALAPVVAALQVDRVVIDGPREIPVDAVVSGASARICDLLHPEIVRGLVVERSRYRHGAALVGALRLAAAHAAHADS